MADVALITAYNGQGELLLGLRRDNGRYTLPGGHLEPGEAPRVGAARELYEETGLRPTSLSYLRDYTTSFGVRLFCYSAYVSGVPHSDYDPDNEVEKWEWVDISEGLPSKYFNNLMGPEPKSGENLVASIFDIAEQKPMKKTELEMDDLPAEDLDTEVDRLLRHPDPVERRMALRLNSVQSGHVARAALDSDPAVYTAALNHPLFTELEGHTLMESPLDSAGQYPLQQQLAFLAMPNMANTAHLTKMFRTARASSPVIMRSVLDGVIQHTQLSEGLIRSIYRGSDATNGHRADLMRHPKVPPDVLDHAIQSAILYPGPDTTAVGRAAAESPNIAPEMRAHLGLQASESSAPHFIDLVCKLLASGPSPDGLGLTLQSRYSVRPGSENNAKVLGAFLSGPSASDGDIDRAMVVGHPAIWQGAARSPALQPRHLDAMVSQAHAAGDKVALSALMDHPAFGNRHLEMLMSPSPQAFAKSESNSQETVKNFTQHPLVAEMMGHNENFHGWLAAARFLSGGRDLDPVTIRRALYQEDGRPDTAALAAYGLPIDDDTLRALRAVRDVGSFDKDEETVPSAQEIAPAFPEGDEVAAAVRRAYEHQFVFYVKLDGKHSNGSMLAHDQQTNVTWLLKSGSGGAGAAAGATQDPSDPNAREAAWYHIARGWDMEEWYPQAEMVYIDGHAYAAMKLLPWSYKSLKTRMEKDPNVPRRILAPYLADGTLHRWAFMDYVLGNGDDNGGNVLLEDPHHQHERHHSLEISQQSKEIEKIRLIDHGSAFSGPAFDPARDQSSFIPFYLRAWAPSTNFTVLPPTEKLQHLPRVDRETAQKLQQWFLGLNFEMTAQICDRYGINRQPQLARVARVHEELAKYPFDEVLNRLWATT